MPNFVSRIVFRDTLESLFESVSLGSPAVVLVFSASETTSGGLVGIFNPSSLGIVGGFTGSVFDVPDTSAVSLLKGTLTAGRKATDVVRGETRLLCGEGFAKVFAVSASGTMVCPWVEAVFADVATSGAVVVVMAFGAALGVVVSSRMFCSDVVDDLVGLLVGVVAEAALGEDLIGDVKR